MKRLPLALIVASFAGALPAQSSHPSAAKPTIVLVHGAFADGSSWQRVIPILQRATATA
jgi:pimeloyl-ACP methyl ester carboxylesterase